jgi:hypothetical protein
MYAEAQQQGAGAQGTQAGGEAKASNKTDESNVVDAEFTEVKDKKG